MESLVFPLQNEMVSGVFLPVLQRDWHRPRVVNLDFHAFLPSAFAMAEEIMASTS